MVIHRQGQTSSGYKPPSTKRVVLMVSTELLVAIDAWGVPAGMRSRTAAINELIKRGMEAVANEQRQAS